jgi:DNA-binding LacI/PurR family transcriptional regulator
MPSPFVSSRAPRATTREIAAKAGVSSATVSLALRNHPKISVKTREHVQRVAAALGYRPDPHVAKLMHHLRTRREPGFQSTICALTTIPEEQELTYLREILKSARQRADALGHGFMILHIDDAVERRPDLQRMLRSRGVEGLLLCPMVRPRAFTELLDWRNFSVVAATNGVLAPEFHRVVPHQFSNTLLLCEQLARRGYRRIGIVLAEQHDLSLNHGFSAAVAWQNLLGGTELVMPLIYQGAAPANLKLWFRREKPDAIIVPGEAEGKTVAKELGLRIPGAVGFASANKAGPSIFAGMEERPGEIGSTAIGLLASMIQRGEKGGPAVPTVTMIKGRWLNGRSLHDAPRKTQATARS